ncbi:phage tail tape measure protein [Peptoniphilus sp. AGMB00490]|uniref:Phage tail tape measure protein n=1 Tax=Peptoniphilus faecalis TaxID=2731255 RepID=A0A848R884_9FIRM|nr:phage tail tape measure protein [Peptoniphilus faecalis]NMW85497.1 phage tail tape measure protein [Peptoniphilus faecalis]
MAKSKIFDATLRLVDKFSKPLETVEKHLTKFQTKYQRTAEGLWATGKNLNSIGKALTKSVTAPITAIGVASTKAWKEVDDALDTIATKTGATGKDMKAFEGTFKNLANKVPADLQEIGDAVGEVNTQFGLTGKALEDASEYMIKFSKINGQDITQASIQAKQAMDSYGLEAKDLSKVLDAVTATAQATGQGTDKLFESLTKSAPQLKAMGIGVEQATALLGGLEKTGIDTSKTMSYMSRAQVAFAKDGLNMNEGLKKLQKELQGAKSETDKVNIASEYFGRRGATFMLDAINRGALDFDSFADAVKNAQGVVGRTFDETQDPIDNFKILFNSLKMAGADLFDASSGIWGPLLEKAIGKVQQLTDWFTNLSDTQKQNIVKWLGMAAAVGPIILGFGKVFELAGKVNFKLFDFAKVVGKAGGITKWFGQSGFGIMFKSFGKFGKVLGKTGIKLGKFAGPVLEKLVGGFGKFSKILGKGALGLGKFVIGLGPVGWAIMAVVAAIVLLIVNWKKIKPVVTKVINAVVNKFNHFKEVAGNVFNHIIEIIKGFIEGAKNLFKSIISFITGTFLGAWNRAWTGVVGAFRTIFSGVKTLVKSVMNGVISFINRGIGGLNKIQVPDWVPLVGGKGINIPLIPKLAKGTNFWRGGIVQIHEKGGEIVDLPRGSRVLPHDKSVAEAYKMGNAKNNNVTITIPKIADQIVVREDADIDRIVNGIANKLKIAKQNRIGGLT